MDFGTGVCSRLCEILGGYGDQLESQSLAPVDHYTSTCQRNPTGNVQTISLFELLNVVHQDAYRAETLANPGPPTDIIQALSEVCATLTAFGLGPLQALYNVSHKIDYGDDTDSDESDEEDDDSANESDMDDEEPIDDDDVEVCDGAIWHAMMIMNYIQYLDAEIQYICSHSTPVYKAAYAESAQIIAEFCNRVKCTPPEYSMLHQLARDTYRFNQ